jgi:hypothetical protein
MTRAPKCAMVVSLQARRRGVGARRSGGRWEVLLAAAGVAVLGVVALRAGTAAAPEPQWAEEAQAALRPFKQRLMAALQDGLAQGPEAAIDACRVEAPGIAASLASPTLAVGRTSHRLRNPDNAPKPWLRPILEEFRSAPPGAGGFRTVRLGGGRVGYAEPIYVQPLCLTCHGTDLAPSVAERIRAAYPDDEATGFALGEFRGLFWVELVPAAAEPAPPAPAP